MRLKIINKIPRIIISGNIANNGVRIKKNFVFPTKPAAMIEQIDLLIKSRNNHFKQDHKKESGVFYSHLRITQPHHQILAVGLGRGSTLISVVKMLNKDGFYRCIEASESQINSVNENISLNAIDYHKFDILCGYAGKDVIGSYGTPSKVNIDINDYDFDILEMDCEGSEISILSSLIKRPDFIIVELHPYAFKNEYSEYSDFDRFIEFMREKKYIFDFAFGHDGDWLTLSDAIIHYNHCKENTKKLIKDQFVFRVCPIVITFKKNNFGSS